jgi:CheY-like chemotaxis protein
MTFSSKQTPEMILVVDDNETVLKTVVGILEHANFRVLSANSAAGALKLAEEVGGKIHMLLCNVDMPEMSGPDLGQTLKKTRQDIHVMLMSGGANGKNPGVQPDGRKTRAIPQATRIEESGND